MAACAEVANKLLIGGELDSELAACSSPAAG